MIKDIILWFPYECDEQYYNSPDYYDDVINSRYGLINIKNFVWLGVETINITFLSVVRELYKVCKSDNLDFKFILKYTKHQIIDIIRKYKNV